MKKIEWQKWASIIFCIIAATALIWFIIKYLLGAFLPFLLAWAVALAIVPAARWISKNTKVPVKFCSVVLLIIMLSILISILTFITNRLIYEIRQLVDRLASGEGEISEGISRIVSQLTNLSEKIPFLRDMKGDPEYETFLSGVNGMIVKLLTDFIGGISSFLPAAILKIISKLPAVLLMLAVTLIACFYFCIDLGAIHEALLSLMPPAVAERVPLLKSRVFGAIGKWLKAYFILFVITFCELLIGFIILGIEYPFLIALLGAFVDILPVFGTGTILVPWGLYELFTKDFRLGFGLLILYVATVIIRQVVEPHVVGGSFGIHPLLALVAMYTGFKFFGVSGMIILPAALMLVKNMMSSDKKKDIKVSGS